MEEMKNENVFIRVAKACYDFKSYPKLIEGRGRSIFAYILVIALINALIWAYVPMTMLNIKTGGFQCIVMDYVPNFEWSYDNFYVEEPMEFSEGNDVIIVTSEVIDLNEIDSQNRALIIDSQQLYFRGDGDEYAFSHQELFDLFRLDKDKVYTKTDFLALSPIFYGIIAFICVIIYICSLISLVMFILICSLIALIINSALKTKLLYSQIFKLTAYAVTFSALLSSILSLVKVSMPLGFIGNYGIVAIYIYLALKQFKVQAEIDL